MEVSCLGISNSRFDQAKVKAVLDTYEAVQSPHKALRKDIPLSAGSGTSNTSAAVLQ